MTSILHPSTAANAALATASMILTTIITVGCGGTVQKDETPNRIEGPSQQVALTEKFRLGVTEPLFARLADVEIGVDGSVYVADGGGATPRVFRFGDDGGFIGNVGTKGEGPGEYGRPQSIIVARDSIIVHDGYWSRINVYEPDGRPRRKTERLSNVSGEMPTSVGNIAEFGGAYVGTEYPVILPGKPWDAAQEYAIRAIDGSGTVGDTLWMISPLELLVVIDERSARQGRAPFGRATLCAFGDDRAYCAWTAALDFAVYDADGTALPSLEIEYTPVPVGESEKAKVREEIDESFLPVLDIPDNRPALLGLAIADDGRLWAKVTTSSDEEESHFWIIDPTARDIAEAVVPGNVSIQSIRDGVACGTVTSPEREQLVVCYHVDA